jgi:uncharacterized protein YbbC (DUF1343 family)
MKNKTKPVRLPVDHLSAVWPTALKGVRLGCLLHPASVTSSIQHTSEVIRALHKKLFNLTAFLGPQHGILGHTQANMIEWEGFDDLHFKIPVYSLYGKNREPTTAMLDSIDCLLIDLQDVGARYYTYIWTSFLALKAAEKNKKAIIVCDRPNPINCVNIEGPVLEMDHASFVGLHPLPVRHGKTIGQLMRQFQKECFPGAQLHVLEMENYNPKMWYDQTRLPWVLPSPNMPTLDTALVYPGMCLLEGTNISEGRGTTKPFEIFGAPFINSPEMCGYLNSLKLPGVFFREMHFAPTFDKWTGQMCHGAQIHVRDRNIFNSFETAVKILHYLYHEYKDEFKWKEPPYEYEYKKLPIDILLGNGWYRKKCVEQ